MKIFPQTMSQSLNESVSDGGDCRTAPATPGLLNTMGFYLFYVIVRFSISIEKNPLC